MLILFSGERPSYMADPRGGYFNGGVYMPSIVAEIGSVVDST